MKKFIFLFTVLFCLFAVSCSNLFSKSEFEENLETTENSTNTKYGSITGNFLLGSAIPSEFLNKTNSSTSQENGLAKTAFPSLPDSLTFNVYAEDSKGNSIAGNIINIGNKYQYEIKSIPFDKEYKIIIEAYYESSTILKGQSESFTLTVENSNQDLEEITLSPLVTLDEENHGYGEIELAIEIDDDVLEKYPNAKIILKDQYPESYWGADQLNNNTFQIILNGLWSGTYFFEIELQDEYGASLYHIENEAVNVFDNLTTDTWIKNGEGEDFLVEQQDGTVKAIITQDLIEKQKYTRPTVYVDSSKTQNGVGSLFSPFITIQEAIDYIESTCTDENADYVINIVNNIDTKNHMTTNPDAVTYFGQTTTSRKRKITIQGFKGESKTIDAKDTNGNSVGIFKFDNENSTITLKNLVLKNASTSGGGAIINKYSLTLDNVEISGFNSSVNNPYAVNTGAISNEGTLKLNKVKISDCSAKSDSYNATGGAIYNSSNGTVTIKNSEISNCVAISEEPKGGAIFNQGSLTIENTSISTCTANGKTKASGGAIYNGKIEGSGGEQLGSCVLNAVTITRCKATIDSTNTNGGAIFNDGNLELKTTTWISDNNDIYLSSGKCITINEELTPIDNEGNPVDYVATIYPEGQPDFVLSGTAIESNYQKFKISKDDYFIKSQGQLFQKKVFYINPEYTDRQNGSFDAPFKTFDDMNNYIRNSTNTEYTINIINNITINEESNNPLINFTNDSSNTFIIQSYDDTKKTINANGKCRLIDNRNYTVVLKNLNLENGKPNETDGGIYNNSILTLENVTIKNCKNTNGKNGIYNNNELTIKGSTCLIDTDIYLSEGKFITIEGELSPKDVEGNPVDCVATITLPAYTADTTVLKGAVENNCEKFKLGHPSWILNKSGKLEKNREFFFVGSSTELPDGETRGTAVTTLQEAINKIEENSNTSIEYIVNILENLTNTSEGDMCKITDDSNGKTITIQGYNNKIYTLDANNKGRVISLNTTSDSKAADITISYLKLVNGKESTTNYGGGICYNSNKAGNLTLLAVNVEDCSATGTGNSGTGGGGIYYSSSGTFKADYLEIKNCSVTSANTSGGGLFSNGNAELTYLSISNCTATENGGGICAFGKLSISNTLGDYTISGCSATRNGGGIYYGIKKSTDDLALSDIIIYNCSADKGGGIYVSDTEKDSALTNVKIYGCTATNGGSGIYKSQGDGFYEKLEIKGSTWLSEDNDIYLEEDARIRVNEVLTPKNNAGNSPAYVATITPSSYTAGTSILTGDKVAENKGKFKVTPDSSGNKYGLDSNGEIIQKLPETKPDNVTTFYIADEEDLLKFINNYSISDGETYIVTDDIALSDDASYLSKSISNNIVFDGNGKTISNLKHPIFNTINNESTVKDLNFEGEYTITGPCTIGGIANCIIKGTIENCTFNGSLNVNIPVINSGDFIYIGGIVGSTKKSSFEAEDICKISKCTNNAQINISEFTYNEFVKTGLMVPDTSRIIIGGITGYSETNITISECTNCGDIIISDHEMSIFTWHFIGGIVGSEWYGNEINKCINKGKILCGNTTSVGFEVGGIAGESRNCIIKNCANKAELKGAVIIGGICYVAYNKVINCYNTGELCCAESFLNEYLSTAGIIASCGKDAEIKLCYNTGEITSTNGKIGGICTTINNATCEHCFYYTENGTYTGIYEVDDVAEENRNDIANYKGCRKLKPRGNLYTGYNNEYLYANFNSLLGSEQNYQGMDLCRWTTRDGKFIVLNYE